MADEIRLVTYANQQVTPQNDAVLTNLETPNNGIIFGCEISIKNASTLHINSGMGVIYGREFEIVDSDISVPLPGAGTELGQLYIHIDLANTSAPVQLLIETGASLTPMVDDPNLNVTTGITEYQLATFNVSTATISDLVVTFENTKGIRTELGTADISGIGDGSVKGAISQINSDLTDVFSDLTNNTCTNLLKPTAQTQTINGVTFTNNGDGTITVNGTANGGSPTFRLGSANGKVGQKMVGCPHNAPSGTYLTYLPNNTWTSTSVDRGDGVIIQTVGTSDQIAIVVENGTTCDNLLFKPMLTTDLNAKYSDYVPYTGDSGRLNEDVSRINSDLTVKSTSYNWNNPNIFYATSEDSTSTMRIRKTENVIYAHFNLITKQAVSANTLYTVATVTDDSFIPTYRAILTSGVFSGSSFSGNVKIFFNTDGTIQVMFDTAHSSTRLYVQCDLITIKE